MKHQITIYKDGQTIILELLALDKNRTMKRKEEDNELYIETFLKDIMSNPKEIKKIDEEDNKLEITFKEKLNLTILNYDVLKDNYILDDVKKALREFKLLEKRKKKIQAYATIFTLSAAAVIAIATKCEKSNDENNDTIKIENETDYNLDNITILESNLEFVLPKQPQTGFQSQHYIEVQESLHNLANLFPEIGSKKEDARKQNVETLYGDLTKKYAKIAGIDQEILECVLAQERGFHSSEKDIGGALGIAQIQVGVHLGETLHLKNKQTGITETFTVTEEMLKDPEGSIKICATLLQNNLDYYNGNTLISVQAYNYGYGAMDEVLNLTELKTGKTKSEIINDPLNLNWIPVLKEFRDGEYGDVSYIENFLNFYDQVEFISKYNDDGKHEVVPATLDTSLIEKSHSL